MSSVSRRTAAIAAAAILVIVAIVTVALPATSAAPSHAPTAPPAGARTSALAAPSPTLQAFGADVGFTPAQSAAALAWLSSRTPAQMELLKATAAEARKGVLPSGLVLAEIGVQPAAFNYYCFGASVVAGAATGGLIGALGTLLGFLAGVMIGGIAGAVVGYYNCQQAGNGAETTLAEETYFQGLMGAYGNEVNLTENDYLNLMSALNVSGVGWMRAADHAALMQLGNSSFNVAQDLFQGQVLANLAPVEAGLYGELGSELASLFTQFNGHAYAGDIYAAGSPSLGPFVPEQYGNATLAAAGAFVGYTGDTGTIYIPHGVRLVSQVVPVGSIVTFQNAITGLWYNWTLTTHFDGDPSAVFAEYFPGPTGIYTVGGLGGAGYDVFAPGAQQVPASTTSGIGQFSGAYFDGPPATGGLLCVGTFGTSCNVHSPYAIAFTGGYTAGYAPANGAGYGVSANPDPLGMWLGSIEWEAAANGAAYWTFLRAAGYTSASQVPADCLIPEPYMVLPSSIANVSLSASEWTSLYESALIGMGHFYNVSLSGVAFCGSQATKQFHIGGAIWGNLYTNATGYVYLNNGTAPTDITGKRLSSETFGNFSSWAVGNSSYPCGYSFGGNASASGQTYCKGAQQLFLMPTLKSVTIPVGTRWAVPQDNPLEVYAVQSGTTLWLYGNGTDTGLNSSACAVGSGRFCPAVSREASSAPGDALYITSCEVGGAVASSCTVTVQTVNVTVQNITCNGPCQVSAPGGGTFGGFPNPFSWLAGLFGGLFGGGPLGSLLGSIAAALLIIGALGLLAYVAIVEVEAWGGRKRRGDGGGSGPDRGEA